MEDQDPHHEEAKDATTLIAGLQDFKGLAALLQDKDVKAAILCELRDYSVPLPGLVYRLICFACGKAEMFMGAAVKSRLQAFIDRKPALAKLLQRLINLQQGEKAKDQLKSALLEAIREGRPVDLSDIAADEAMSLEMMQALHMTRGLEGLTAGLDEASRELAETFRADLADHYAEFKSWYQTELGPNLRFAEDLSGRDDLTLTAFQRLQYNSGINALFGREAELEMLGKFAGDADECGPDFAFRWLLLTADGGSGKSRLAYEFAKGLDDRVWNRGFLHGDDLEKFDRRDRWRPRTPTFLIIDYARARSKLVGDLIRLLTENRHKFEFPVRLLLLERVADASWTNDLVPPSAMEPVVRGCCFGEEAEKGLPLPPIHPGAIVALMEARFAKAGIEPPDKEGLLFETAVGLDPHQERVLMQDGEKTERTLPRPLFAAVAADAMIDHFKEHGDWPESLHREAVFDDMIKRDRQNWWGAAEDDARVRAKYEMALAVATLTGGLDLYDLDDKERLFGRAERWLPDAPTGHVSALVAAMGGEGCRLPNMEPDLLGEFFVLQQLGGNGLPPKVRTALLNGALTLGEGTTVESLLRIWQDFPDAWAGLAIADVFKEADEAVAELLSDLAVRVTSTARARYKDEAVGALLEALSQAVDRLQSSRCALGEAMAAFNVASDAGEARDWARVDGMLTRLSALRAAFPDDLEIALAEAKAAVNVTRDVGEAGDWARVDKMLARLSALRAAFPDDQEIALEEATVAFNVTYYAGEAGDWGRVDGMLARIDALRASFPDDQEIALQEAKAAVNVSIDARKAGDWGRVDKMLARFSALRDAFPNDQRIALQEAMAALNVTSDAGEAGDWARVKAMRERLEAVRLAFGGALELGTADDGVTYTISDVIEFINHFLSQRPDDSL